MPDTSIETSIDIQASAAQVWRMFTDPDFTKPMGGEYVCDWKPGSSFGWKGTSGEMFTAGQLLEIEPERLLRHLLYRSVDSEDVLATVTYTLTEKDGRTTVSISEVFMSPITDDERDDALTGWTVALQAVKELSETIESL